MYASDSTMNARPRKRSILRRPSSMTHNNLRTLSVEAKELAPQTLEVRPLLPAELPGNLELKSDDGFEAAADTPVPQRPLLRLTAASSVPSAGPSNPIPSSL